MNERLVSLNGSIVPASEASVSVMDRGLRYGDGVFETVRIYGGTVFEWGAHRDRLHHSCEQLSLSHGLGGETLHDRIRETVAANDLVDAAARLSITRGVQPGRLSPADTVEPTVIVTVDSLPRGGTTGTVPWDEPATLASVDTTRIPDTSIPASAKTLNYLNGILARLELDEEDEALLLDGSGAVAEGATSNVFFVDDGVVHTPSLEGPVLPGITRQVVLDIATTANIPTETGTYRPTDLRGADELFLTNSTWEIRPVAAVDGVPLEVGPHTTGLQERFAARVERRCYDG